MQTVNLFKKALLLSGVFILSVNAASAQKDTVYVLLENKDKNFYEIKSSFVNIFTKDKRTLSKKKYKNACNDDDIVIVSCQPTEDDFVSFHTYDSSHYEKSIANLNKYNVRDIVTNQALIQKIWYDRAEVVFLQKLNNEKYKFTGAFPLDVE